jgi:hypothetical protein
VGRLDSHISRRVWAPADEGGWYKLQGSNKRKACAMNGTGAVPIKVAYPEAEKAFDLYQALPCMLYGVGSWDFAIRLP